MLAFAAAAFIHAPSLLDHARTALHAKGQPFKEARLSGRAISYGVAEAYSLRIEPGVRFLLTTTGPISEVYGSDGKLVWHIDRNRTVMGLDLEDRDKVLAIGLAMTDAWLEPAAPVTIREEGGALKLKLKPSGQDVTIKLDSKTWLPIEASIPDSSGALTVKLRNWKSVGDRRIPTHVEVTDGGQTDVMDANAISTSSVDPSAFNMPAWTPDDVSFDAAQPAKIEAKRAISGHVLIHPLVNGKDIGWFILDSGAETTVIDKTAADDQKLGTVGHNPLTGVGGTIQSSFRPLDEIKVGPATLRKLLVPDLDLAPYSRVFGVTLGGVLGADFFRRSIVTIDLKGSTVEVFPRPGYVLASGAWLPMRFSSGNPAIEATMDGAPKSWFRFDTGADGTVALHAPFVKKWKLLEGKVTTPSGMGGVGGMVSARRGPIKWFEIAGHRFDHPSVLFSLATQGAFAEPYLAGNIGQDFMMPFRMVFDFTGNRIALIPH